MANKKINILFCVGQSGYIGGAEIQLAQIIKNLDRRIFNSFIIFPGNGKTVKFFKSEGLKTKIIHPARWASDRKKMLKYMKDSRIDLVCPTSPQEFSFQAATAARSLKIFNVWHMYCDLSVIYPRLKGIRKKNVLGLLQSLSEKVVACSQYAVRQFKGISKPVIVNNGVDIRRFRPIPRRSDTGFRARYKISEDTIVAAMVGRLSPEKRHPDFIRASSIVKKKYPAIKFFIIGGETTTKYLRQLNRLNSKFGSPVLFLDFLGDMKSVMNAIDLLIVPSIGDAAPRVILEAMACEKPVIAADSGGIPEMILNGKTGLLVPPKDPYGLAKKISGLINDRKKTNLMGRLARNRAEKDFDIRKTTKQLESLYLEILGKKKDRRFRAR